MTLVELLCRPPPYFYVLDYFQRGDIEYRTLFGKPEGSVGRPGVASHLCACESHALPDPRSIEDGTSGALESVVCAPNNLECSAAVRLRLDFTIDGSPCVTPATTHALR